MDVLINKKRFILLRISKYDLRLLHRRDYFTNLKALKWCKVDLQKLLKWSISWAFFDYLVFYFYYHLKRPQTINIWFVYCRSNQYEIKLLVYISSLTYFTDIVLPSTPYYSFSLLDYSNSLISTVLEELYLKPNRVIKMSKTQST